MYENPDFTRLLADSAKRSALAALCVDGFDRIEYLLNNPWLDMERIVSIADSIMNISPDTVGNELLSILCKDVVLLTDARAATCRTYDPLRNTMVASGAYNWEAAREESIPYEDSLAGRVIREKKHLCIPDIAAEPLYREKEHILARGINSMLAIPIELVDYEGTEKKEVLLGALQIYFGEKDKRFYDQQIKLLKSVVSRFSYVLAQQRKRALQKKSLIIQQSRKALFSVVKRTQSLDQVLSFLVARIAETININRCSLFSIEQGPDQRRVAILVAGYPVGEHTYGVTLSFDQHPAFREVCESGRPLLIEEARKDPRMQASVGLYLYKKIENVYFLPIKNEEGRVSHVLVFDGDESRPLDKEDLFYCNALIQDIELCIQVSLRSQEWHDFFNQMISFGAIAKVYTKKLNAPNANPEELGMLYKKLYRSMLAVNDIITDRVPFAQKEWFNVKEVLAERLEAYYLPDGVEVEENSAGDPVMMHADRKKVGRIIGNLLDNASRKLEEIRQGRLTALIYVDNRHAVIEIGNTGCVPEEVLAALRRNHVHAQPGVAQDRGQGLTIVKLFTVMHNGMFVFDSSPEANWTVFRVLLPLE